MGDTSSISAGTDWDPAFHSSWASLTLPLPSSSSKKRTVVETFPPVPYQNPRHFVLSAVLFVHVAVVVVGLAGRFVVVHLLVSAAVPPIAVDIFVAGGFVVSVVGSAVVSVFVAVRLVPAAFSAWVAVPFLAEAFWERRQRMALLFRLCPLLGSLLLL